MPTAYQVLSAIVLLAIPASMLTFCVVEHYRISKKTSDSKYNFWLRIRNLEFYLLGVCYPIKAVIGVVLHHIDAVDIIWGIIWLMLAGMVFKKYRFGTTPLVKKH